MNSKLVNTGQYVDLTARGIDKNTCQFYKYQVGTYTGYIGKEMVTDEPVHIANYCNDIGETVAQKIRASNKRMCMKGDGKRLPLFGQQLWTPSENVFVTITEGEIDALSVAQVCSTKYPVVSVPNGAHSARNAIKDNLEWLQKFKYVVLAFDNDEQGIKATKDCIDLFEPGKVRVAQWSLKDANELLVNDRAHEIKNAIWNASIVRPDSIVEVDDIIEEALIPPEYGVSFPWQSLTEITYGIQSNSIYTIGAGSGIGKTEFLKDIMLHLVHYHGEKVGALFLEQKPAQTLLRLVGGLLGKRLHVPGDDWNKHEIKAGMEELRDKVYFYDHFGNQDIDIVLDKIRYMVKSMGVKYIILDHLTALAANMKDERKGIDLAMSKLGGLVHELDFTLFLVSHLAKPPADDKSYEEGKMVTASAFRGSQSIQYWSSFMLGLERNKLAQEPLERLITTVRILKDRFTGEADGATFYLKYDRKDGKLKELSEEV